MMMNMTTAQRTYSGGCHCGAVRFEVDVPAQPEVWHCNCSVCGMCGFQHLIVPREAFRLLSGRERLKAYRFNTQVAEHLFCSTCGIKSFYVPRSHPDGYSVNVRCLDGAPLEGIEPRDFDGQNWEEGSATWMER
jgi:hypothetical protein